MPAERLKGVELFVAVVNAGSFTAAAERLSLTNSAVGKAVVRLETRLQCQLFERGARRLRLTDAGESFHRVCVRVLEEVESAERLLHAGAIAPAGRLRIDMPATFGHTHGMPALLAYLEKYPQVIPHLSFTDHFVDPVENGLDLALRIGGSSVWPAALGHRYLGSEALVFCAAPSYLAQHGCPASPEALFSHAAVLYGRADGSISPWRFTHPDAPLTHQHVEGRIIVGQAEAQVDAVEAGLGIAQLATWLVERQIKQGTVVSILPELSTTGLPLHLVWQRSREHTVKVQTLIAHFEATLRMG